MIDSGYADMCNENTGKYFKEGKLVFESHLIGNFKGYRDAEDDFGVIPWPSLYENTEIKVYCRNPSDLLVPKCQGEDERLGVILSALAAYGYDYITDNYINRTVIGKGMRDRESGDAVVYMIDSIQYDVACSYGLESVDGGWMKAVMNGTYSSQQMILDKMIKKLLGQSLEPYSIE